jgi:DNA transformation protein and related proteins
MDAEGLKELFEPLGAVSVRRMFSGHGVYADGLFFALEIGGEIYLKSNAESAAAHVAAGSTPFSYQGAGRRVTTNLWRLAASAYDDPDELRRWSGLALDAAREAALNKAARSASGKRRGASRAQTPARKR